MWITIGFLIAFALSAASELDNDEDAIIICTEEEVNAECAHANSGYEIVGVALRSCSTNSAEQSNNETCVENEYIAQLQQRLAILEEKLKSIDNKMEKMDQEVNSTNGRMTIADKKLETMDNMFLIVTNSVATSINEVKTVNSRITTIDDKLEQLNQEVNSTNNRITDMDNKFESINHTLSTVNNSVDNSINEVMIINNKITTIDHKLERMEQKVNSTNSRITDTDNRLVTTNNMLSIVTNSVATSINEVKTVNSRITTIDDKLQQLEQEVNSSDSRMTDIENRLETFNDTISTVNTSVITCVNRVDYNITAIIDDLQKLNQSMSTIDETIATAINKALNKTGQNDWTTITSPQSTYPATTTANPTEGPYFKGDYRAAREELEKSGEIAIVGDREGSKVTELTWRVEKIEEDIEKAKVDENYNISKSFYSDAPGYRMTLYMYPRSRDSSSIIVCGVFIPGMFDNAVPFPMTQRYKITSIDLDGQQFVTNSFTYIHEQDSQLSSLPQPNEGSSRQCYSFHIITDTLMSMKNQLLPDGHLSIRTTFYFDD